jgi:hypothetical protein
MSANSQFATLFAAERKTAAQASRFSKRANALARALAVRQGSGLPAGQCGGTLGHSTCAVIGPHG